MNILEKARNLIYRYRHAWVFSYALIYLPWFHWLESRKNVQYYLIHSPIDDLIPFIEYFIVPYLLWFAFITVSALYFFFTDRSGFYRMAAFLIAGMTIFLLICTFFPNGLNLRPDTFERDNVFTDLVRAVYTVDTSTNVLPSIHVFNSIGMVIAISHSQTLKKHRAVRYSSYMLALLIILSTMFLKQHSITDVVAAFALATLIYPFVYATQDRKASRLSQQLGAG